jgi:hypothetical protein
VTRAGPLDPRTSWIGFLLAAGAGLVALFVVLDPAPSRGLSAPLRTLYWTAHVFLPLGLAQAAQVLLSRSSRLLSSRPWTAIAAAGLLGSALFVPLALLLDRLFDPEGGTESAGEPLGSAMVEEWVSLAPAVTLVWLGLNAARFLQLPRAPSPDAPGIPAVADAPAFLDRLPPSRRGDLVALSAELHYLRIYTTRGDGLVLYGFGEALSDLGPDAGLQLHRSHWVDPRFVSGVDRADGRMSVRTTTGLVLPVARNRRAAVSAALGALTG